MADGTRDRWREADDLFQAALDRPPEERAAFVATSCAGDLPLREAVEALLRAEAASSGFLNRPLDDLTSIPWDRVLSEAEERMDPGRPAAEEQDRSGERVGPYRLIRRLGRGGMATVYLAERADGLWERQVALKLVRRGLDTDDVIRRFLAERRILSTLNHPNIAALLDGGTTDQGLPYLAMEYVEGTPITEYCDQEALGVEARLRLFCAAGRAVQHAHRSLVVHRDLKPSNILVTTEGRVKLLDFGIAKILDPAEEGASTRTGLRPLTPEYASPEQAGGEAITTASDVYQLGILLCELLSGRRPYEIGRVRSAAGLRSFLDGVDPARPSALITPGAARRRAAGPERLARALRGDLDNIVLHAVPREPERRYMSAEALVADVERHLDGLPVTARPATLLYRTRKLLRRRPWLGPAVAAALVVLAGYVVTLARHSRALEEERNVARVEAERAEEVQRFLVDIFHSADPYAGPAEVDRDLTVREALAVGADRVRAELAGRPDLQATLLATIGDVYANVDMVEPARLLREESLTLDRAVHGPRSAQVARDLRELGTLVALEGPLDSAETLLTRSLELTRGTPGDRSTRDTAVAGVLVDLADVVGRRGRPEEAEEHLMSAVELLRNRDPLPTAALSSAYTALLDVYPGRGRMVEARAAAQEAVRLARLAWGEEHPRTAVALAEAADLRDWEGRGAEAVPTYREAIAILDRTLGPDHQRTLDVRNNLAVTLRHLGDLEGAEAVHRSIVRAWRSKPGDRPQALADALQNLAVVLEERGALAEAEEALEEARDLYDAVLEEGHPRRAFPRLTLASVRLARGQFEAAEAAAREAVGILAGTLPESSYVTATARCRLGRALAGQGRTDPARTLLEDAVAILARAPQPTVRYEVECRRGLAALYRSLGEETLAEAQEAASDLLRDGGPPP